MVRYVIDFYRFKPGVPGGIETVRRLVAHFDNLEDAVAYALPSAGVDGFRVYQNDLLKNDTRIPRRLSSAPGTVARPR